MKGLTHYPTTAQLAHAIHSLETNKKILTRELAFYSSWSRIDPRVAECLTAHLGKNWSRYSPLHLNKRLKETPWPCAFGVILEFAKLYFIHKKYLHAFQNWAALVMYGIQPNCYAQFFYGLRKVSGIMMIDDARFSLNPYLKWGYLGREFLVKSNKKYSGSKSPWPKSTRHRILKELLRNNKRITISDYLNILNNNLSRRQAERDLIDVKIALPRGQTRAREYVLK